MKLTPEELEQLQDLVLARQGAEAGALLAQNRHQLYLHSIEKKYKLKGQQANLNVDTGEITVDDTTDIAPKDAK